jgi:chemotaxis protein methyltransferase CheR
MMTSHDDNHADELDLLLEAIFRTYRYDFRRYVRSSLRRRVEHALAALRSSSIAHLAARVVDDPQVFAALLRHLTIQVSDLFRDPGYWRALRQRVVPYLSTYPFLRIWVAGCGAGEEAYSMAILLREEGLLERSQIYATDIVTSSLESAAEGQFELGRARAFSDNYLQAGGKASLSDYYTTTRSHVAFAPELRRRILFSDHSLATDAVFAEVQLVSCRNVLIYFDRGLQDRAVGVFVGALCPRGFLGLGSRESLMFSTHAGKFEPFAAEHKIYRRTHHETHR